MAKLHPQKFRELEPEFRAFEHIKKAHELLEGAGTDTAGRARYYTEHGLRALHPLVNDEDAHVELEQRLSGSYVDPDSGIRPRGRQHPQQTQQTASTSEVERENAQLRARLAELENARTQQPPSGGGNNNGNG